MIGIAAGYTSEGEISSLDNFLDDQRWEETHGAAVTAESTDSTEIGTEEPAFAAVETTEPAYAEYVQTEAEETETESETIRLQKKIGSMKDKKLAITALNRVTESIDEGTPVVLTVFIEDAFVNISDATVVDRGNVDKVIEEQQLQLSGLVDSETAVQIGKLIGSQFIVIGDISFVGSKYYLRTKLVNVETAEVYGSSISITENEDGFLDMCNNSVLALFE